MIQMLKFASWNCKVFNSAPFSSSEENDLLQQSFKQHPTASKRTPTIVCTTHISVATLSTVTHQLAQSDIGYVLLLSSLSFHWYVAFRQFLSFSNHIYLLITKGKPRQPKKLESIQNPHSAFICIQRSSQSLITQFATDRSAYFVHFPHSSMKFHKPYSSRQLGNVQTVTPILPSTFSHLYILYLVVNPCW